MALRRPPTRIELKADDIDEYDQVSGKKKVRRVIRRTHTQPRYAAVSARQWISVNMIHTNSRKAKKPTA
jgi:hypothetical protein